MIRSIFVSDWRQMTFEDNFDVLANHKHQMALPFSILPCVTSSHNKKHRKHVYAGACTLNCFYIDWSGLPISTLAKTHELIFILVRKSPRLKKKKGFMIYWVPSVKWLVIKQVGTFILCRLLWLHGRLTFLW